MKLYDISNMQNVVRALESCAGDVRIAMPDGKLYQWESKNEDLYSSLLKSGNSLDIRCTRPDDTMRVMNCAMDDRVAKRTA